MDEPKRKPLVAIKLAFIALIVCLFSAIFIPKFIQGRKYSQANTCINYLSQINSAKYEWASDHHAKPGDVVTTNDLLPYLLGGVPKCPAGGTYSIGKIGEYPTCSLGTTVTPAHVLP
jgi:hypothetical protein